MESQVLLQDLSTKPALYVCLYVQNQTTTGNSQSVLECRHPWACSHVDMFQNYNANSPIKAKPSE